MLLSLDETGPSHNSLLDLELNMSKANASSSSPFGSSAEVMKSTGTGTGTGTYISLVVNGRTLTAVEAFLVPSYFALAWFPAVVWILFCLARRNGTPQVRARPCLEWPRTFVSARKSTLLLRHSSSLATRNCKNWVGIACASFDVCGSRLGP